MGEKWQEIEKRESFTQLLATSLNQRRAWINQMRVAQEDARVYVVKRQEMETLEQQVKQIQLDKTDKKK